MFNTSAVTNGAFKTFASGNPLAMKSRNMQIWLLE
jgi:hypothetical protein